MNKPKITSVPREGQYQPPEVYPFGHPAKWDGEKYVCEVCGDEG